MSESGVAKIFMHGRSQAVRLPKEFRLPGTEVRVRRHGAGLLLEPVAVDLEALFAEMDRKGAADFLEGWERDQPPMPPGKAIFD